MSSPSSEELLCEECEDELQFCQLEAVVEDNGTVITLGSERQDTTEYSNKAQTQTGAKVNIGASSSGPNASGGGFIQDIDAIENKDVVSRGKSISITQNSGQSLQIQWLNPENVDPDDEQNYSGCLNDDCSNSIANEIEAVKTASEQTAAQLLTDSEEDSQESSEMWNDKDFDGFLELMDNSDIPIEEIDPRDELRDQSDISPVHKFKSGLSSAVGRASGAAATIRGGLNTTVEKARGQFESDDSTLSVSPDDGTDLDVAYRDDGTTVTLADSATETVGTTVAVGTSGEFQPSYDDGTFTVDIDEAADATIAVSPGTDDADWSVTDDGVEMGLADGAVTVDRGADDLQMGTDDGTITLAMGDGHTPERSSTNANGNDTAASNETTHAEATEKTTPSSEPAQSANNGEFPRSNASDAKEPVSQAQSGDTTTPFLGYDDGREQVRHRNGNNSTGTTNSEETSNDNSEGTNEDTDNDETKDPGGTSL